MGTLGWAGIYMVFFHLVVDCGAGGVNDRCAGRNGVGMCVHNCN